MAQDKTDKAIRLAADYVDLAARLTDIIRDSRALQDRKEQDGIDFATFEAAIQAAGGLEHLTANILNGCITNSQALRTFLATGTAGIDPGLLGGNLEDAFYQARRD